MNLKKDCETPNSVPFCRICHDKSPRQALITPCNCMGTVSWVHRNCLECWLTQSHNNRCELCGVLYICRNEPPGFYHWLVKNPRPLLTDLLLCIFLTPLAILSVVLCYRGAVSQIEWQNAFESLCLFALGSFLLGVFLAWIGLTIRSHYYAFLDWQRANPIVKVIWPAAAAVAAAKHDRAKQQQQRQQQRAKQTTVSFNPREDEVYIIGPGGTPTQSSPTDSLTPTSDVDDASRIVRLRSLNSGLNMSTPRRQHRGHSIP